MIESGISLANDALLSPCFRTGVLAATMTHTGGETAQQVYDALTQLPPVILNFDLFDGTSAHGTMAYDDSGDPYTIHLNTYFIKTNYLVGSTTLHEAAHARGYIHKRASEGSSVPYTMNYIFEQCTKIDPVKIENSAP